MVIYKTINLVNGKIYVGKDSLNDPSYFGSGLILHRAIRKHGLSNFRKDILEFCSSPQELDRREKHWITQLDSTNRHIGYNIAKGGTGGDTFTNQSTSKKSQILAKRAATRPRWLTNEYRKKIRKSSIALWNNPHHRSHIQKVMTGREIKWADKISKSISEWHKSRVLTEEGRKKMREAGKKAKGREIKHVSKVVTDMVIAMYQSVGPKTISLRLKEQGILVSPYLVIRILKTSGVYQKWQKGISKNTT